MHLKSELTQYHPDHEGRSPVMRKKSEMCNSEKILGILSGYQVYELKSYNCHAESLIKNTYPSASEGCLFRLANLSKEAALVKAS